MKSYEKALAALLAALKATYEAQAHAVGDLRAKAIDFIDACDKAPASARNELKTGIKRLKPFQRDIPIRNMWRA